MKDHESIRISVSETYSKAVKSSKGCCGWAVPKGVAAKTAGYDPASLAGLPEGTIENSFGCGNPLAFSDVKPGDVVLDLGSGAGLDLLIASEKVGSKGHVIGIDMTDEMLSKAAENIRAAGAVNIELRKGLIEQLPVEDSSVDWVISNCVINLSPEKERVFAEIARVLRPGGHMRVSDLVVEDLPAWVRGNERLYCTCIAGAISGQEYLDGLQAAGLTGVRILHHLVYDESQVTDLVASELGEMVAGTCCGGVGIGDAITRTAARELAGKVQSVVVVAEKPGV